MSRLTQSLALAVVLIAPFVNGLMPASARAAAPMPGLPTAIFSTVLGTPSAAVPGVEDARFTSLYAPSGSPNGVHWVLRAEYEVEGVTVDALVTGRGVASARRVALTSGQSVAAGGVTYHFVSFRTWTGINDQG